MEPEVSKDTGVECTSQVRGRQAERLFISTVWPRVYSTGPSPGILPRIEGDFYKNMRSVTKVAALLFWS